MLKLETRADLDALFTNQVPESATLEYKASPAIDQKKRDEIVKDISAMANAEGGQIIYGMTEANHLPAGLDEGVDSIPFDGLWFEQVIQQNISPKIEGLKILLVPLGTGNNAVVVSVPQSATIHQAKVGVYYRRRNFRIDIMADYEIREALKRSQTPVLDVLPAFKEQVQADHVPLDQQDGGGSRPFDMDFMVFNKSSQPAEYAVLIVSLDVDIQVVGTEHFVFNLGVETTKTAVLQKLAANLGFPASPPLFKENPESAGTISISVPDPRNFRTYQMTTEIRTPGYSQKKIWVLTQHPYHLYLRLVS